MCLWETDFLMQSDVKSYHDSQWRTQSGTWYIHDRVGVATACLCPLTHVVSGPCHSVSCCYTWTVEEKAQIYRCNKTGDLDLSCLLAVTFCSVFCYFLLSLLLLLFAWALTCVLFQLVFMLRVKRKCQMLPDIITRRSERLVTHKWHATWSTESF